MPGRLGSEKPDSLTRIRIEHYISSIHGACAWASVTETRPSHGPSTSSPLAEVPGENGMVQEPQLSSPRFSVFITPGGPFTLYFRHHGCANAVTMVGPLYADPSTLSCRLECERETRGSGGKFIQTHTDYSDCSLANSSYNTHNKFSSPCVSAS